MIVATPGAIPVTTPLVSIVEVTVAVPDALLLHDTLVAIATAVSVSEYVSLRIPYLHL